MSNLLQNQIAVITGAGSGIGRAIAAGYAREGARLALLDMNYQAAAEVASDIKAAGGSAVSFALDVTKSVECVAIAQRLAGDLGTASILVNAAGIIRRNPFSADAEAVAKDWDDILAVNLDGVFNVTRAFLDQLRANKGRIINIGSLQSLLHMRTPSSTAYTVSKHGVLGFTRALAAELGKDGVRVNAIGPGLIETPLNAATRAKPEILQTFLTHTPLGRTGQPDDIVGPAVFLASEMSAYVTGAILMVDGGYSTI